MHDGPIEMGAIGDLPPEYAPFGEPLYLLEHGGVTHVFEGSDALVDGTNGGGFEFPDRFQDFKFGFGELVSIFCPWLRLGC